MKQGMGESSKEVQKPVRGRQSALKEREKGADNAQSIERRDLFKLPPGDQQRPMGDNQPDELAIALANAAEGVCGT